MESYEEIIVINMARLTSLLIFCACLLTFLKFSSHSILPYFSIISTLLESKFIQSSFLLGVLALFLYSISDSLTSQSSDQSRFFADQITPEEYEKQKRSYTQQKLAELFNTKEYQDYIRNKTINQTPKPQSLEESDEEL